MHEWTSDNWPLYTYTFEQLMGEEAALAGQPRWYEGAHDGKTWISEMVFHLIMKYHQ